MANAEITYEDIDRLLTSLGFTCEVRTTERKIPSDPPKEHVVYWHKKEGTILKFPAKGSLPCLHGELMSLRAHLVGRGHIDEDAISTFVETGHVPVLS
jgi:hypothetical protein